MDPVVLATEIGAKLVEYIAQAIADGAKDARTAKRVALQRLVDEHQLEPVLDDVQSAIADARRPAAERDAEVTQKLPTSP